MQGEFHVIPRALMYMKKEGKIILSLYFCNAQPTRSFARTYSVVQMKEAYSRNLDHFHLDNMEV